MDVEAGTATPSVDGWVQYAGDPEWAAAQLSTERGFLIVRRDGHPADRIHLARITALDDLLGEYPGSVHVEIAVDGRPALQLLWPESFTPVVVDALAESVEEPSAAPLAFPEPVLPESAVPAAAMVAEEPAPPPERVRIKGQSRAGSAMIGLLAVAGCVAIVIGVMGLRSAPSNPGGSDATTTTTTRPRPTSLVAPSASVTGPGDACDDQPAVTTTVPGDTVVCAEG